MTEVITSSEEHFDTIRKCITKNATVKIATYNLYVGVLSDGRYVNDWGPGYRNEAGLLLDELCRKHCDVTIKVGKPRQAHCPLKGVSIPREETENYLNTSNLIVTIGEKYPGYNIQDIDDYGYLEFLASRQIKPEFWTIASRAELKRRGVEKLPDPYDPRYYDSEDSCSKQTTEEKWDDKFKEAKKRWAKINFQLVEESHMKLVLVSPHHSIFGGRNFTDSSDVDLTFYSKEKKLYNTLMKEFEQLT